MDKYLQYTPIEFSQEDSFIRWAKGSASKDNFDWNSFLDQNPDKANDINDAKKIVQSIQFKIDLPNPQSENEIWSKISGEINKEQVKVTPRRNILRLISYGAAAAVAIFLIATNLTGDYDTTINAPMAKVENVTLPDGSKVMVNANSTLQYDKETWDTERKIELGGEAFFEVQKGSKFTVHTNNGSVEVLGTSFNVFARGKKLNVHCETGKVGVSCGKKQTILTPKQSVFIEEGNHDFKEIIKDSEKRSTWTKGIFVYKETPLSEVVNELERQFDLKIDIASTMRGIKYSGSFNKQNIETALSEVFWPLNLKYTLEGQKVTVSK